MARRLLLTFIFVAGAASSLAQADGALGSPQYLEGFRKTYNGPHNHSDRAAQVASDGQGGCYVAGENYDAKDALYDVRIVAYDAKGGIRWTLADLNSTFGGNDNAVDRLYRPAAMSDVWMVSRAERPSGRYLRISRLSYAGQVRFKTQVRAGAQAGGFPVGLYVDARGFAYLTFGRDGGAVVLKLGPTGKVAWSKTVVKSDGSSMSAAGTAVKADSQGVYVAGIERSLGGGYFTAKLDHAGVLRWLARDPGPIGNTLGPAFLERGGDGVVVLTSPESSFGVPKYRVTRLAASSGAVVWAHYYKPDATADAQALGLGLDPFGNAYVAAFRLAPKTGSFIVKYAADGKRLWERTLADGIARGFALDGSGNAFVGTIDGSLSGTTQHGTLLYAQQRKRDWYASLAADPQGNVFAVGSAFFKASGDDFVTLKLRRSAPALHPPAAD